MYFKDLEFLSEFSQKPQLFAESTARFWDDEHISMGMLDAHLNPDWEAASRKHIDIDMSVEWIVKVIDLQEKSHILDLGCGPGLYCTRFYKKNMKITGVDYSRRSIDYAYDYAVKADMSISYLHQNYLQGDLGYDYDLVTLIYCDFGVLNDEHRTDLLNEIYRCLKPGGYFIFDVFTPEYLKTFKETSSWEFHEKGFWRPVPHVELYNLFKYHDEKAMVRQHIIMDSNNNTETYRIWDRVYTEKEIRSILDRAGFKNIKIYGDIKGGHYTDKSETMAVIVQK